MSRYSCHLSEKAKRFSNLICMFVSHFQAKHATKVEEKLVKEMLVKIRTVINNCHHLYVSYVQKVFPMDFMGKYKGTFENISETCIRAT